MAVGRALAVVFASSAVLLAAGEPPEEGEAACLVSEASCRKSLVQRGYNIATDLQEGELDERNLPPLAPNVELELLQTEREALSMSPSPQPSASDWFESYGETSAGRDSLPELDPQALHPQEQKLERQAPLYTDMDSWAGTDAEDLSPELAEAMRREALAAARLPDMAGHAWQQPGPSARHVKLSSERVARGVGPADVAASPHSQLQTAAVHHRSPTNSKVPVAEYGIRPALISVVAMADKAHDAWVRTPVASSLLAIRHKVLGSTVEVHREAMVMGMIVVSISGVFITVVAGSVLFMSASRKR